MSLDYDPERELREPAQSFHLWLIGIGALLALGVGLSTWAVVAAFNEQ